LRLVYASVLVMIKPYMKKKSSFIVSLLILSALLIISVYTVSFSAISGKKEAQADTSLLHLAGYAWSSNIGWISFGSVGYSATIDPSTGNMGGYAWADPHDDIANTDNIGWISFNETTGCPVGPCQANVNLTTGQITGWGRVISNDPSWDGWVALSGTNFASPAADGSAGSTYNPSNKNFVGYMWDSGVLGWVQLNPPGGGVHIAQCGDGIDNDGNGLADMLDPGCHVDGNPNNSTSYNPAIVSEKPHACDINDFAAPTWGECTDGEQSAVWTKLANDNCTGNYTPPTETQKCIDNGSTALGAYTLKINPAVISKGGTCNVTWSIDKKTAPATKCTLAGLSVPSGYTSFDPKTKGYGETLHYTNSNTGTYTLSCKSGDTQGVVITKTCTIAPAFNEF